MNCTKYTLLTHYLVQMDLGDIPGSAPGHCNETGITMKSYSFLLVDSLDSVCNGKKQTKHM